MYRRGQNRRLDAARRAAITGIAGWAKRRARNAKRPLPNIVESTDRGRNEPESPRKNVRKSAFLDPPQARGMTALPRARCRHCGRLAAVRVNGSMREHKGIIGN